MGLKMRGTQGQMTVEFLVALPVMLIIAVIATNALLFFSECAAFDRVVRDAVRVHATSPTYGQSQEQSCAYVTQLIESKFEQAHLDTVVETSGGSLGHREFKATLFFAPTLFGMGMRSSILGIDLPALKHTVSYTIDPYKPGVLL